VDPFSFYSELENLTDQFGGDHQKLAEKFCSLVSTLHSKELRNDAKIPYFPGESLPQIMNHLTNFPGESPEKVVRKFYPFKVRFWKIFYSSSPHIIEKRTSS